MIPVRMADQQHLDIAELESQLLDARLDHRHVRLEVTGDEDVTLRRRDQIVRETLASDLVQVLGDPERGVWLGPVRGALRFSFVGEGAEHEEGGDSRISPTFPPYFQW